MDGNEPGRTLYLVDGTSQLFRAFYAIRGLSNEEGLPTNALYGFTTMLRRLLQEENPSHIAVAFDLPGPTFRHDRYADYKAHRPPSPEDLDRQVPWAKEICRGFNIPVLELPGYEADDLIATYASRAERAGFRVVVVASDKDLLQLVDDAVTVLNPSKNLRFDAAAVEASFGVAPASVRDVLGLMGDAVDNIPGVPGVGEKTALGMVAAYGRLEEVLRRAAALVVFFEARDRLVAALEQAPGAPEADTELSERADAFRRRARDLMAVERDQEFGSRVAAVIEALDATQRTREMARALKDLDKGSGRRVWTAVHENAEQALMSRDLATVDREVPVEFDLRSLALRPPDLDRLAQLFRALGFRTLLSRIAEAPEASSPPQASAARGEYRAVTTLEALQVAVEACRAARRFAVDTETDGTDPMRARLVGISVAWSMGGGVYIPIGHDYLGAPDQLSLDEIRRCLGPVLADASIGKIGQNLKYDHHILDRHGLPVAGWQLDTMVAAFLLDPDRPSFGMDALAKDLLGYEPIPYEALAGSGSKAVTLNSVEVERVTEYAAEDADVTLRLAGALEPRLEAEGLAELYRRLDGPLLPVLARMEAHGIRVDTAVLRTMASEMEAALNQARVEIHRLAGTAFNVDSPKQLRDVLFGRLGIAPRRKTVKSGVHSTDAATLEELAEEHEIARRIMEYRELAKLKGTYVDSLPLLVNPGTGRVHTCYHPTGAATGRLSSSDPNLQNIPARSPLGLKIRAAFVPDPSHVFLASDYSQIELRVLAHLCGDPELVAAFRAGEDIHRHTASRVFGVVPERVTEAMRRRAKAVNFGILYGMSESRLARDQGISRTEARQFIESYFRRFRGVRDYVDKVRQQARQDACVRTLFGRVRYFPDLHRRTTRAAEEAALRAAVNTTIQGTAADLMKMAMLRLEDALAGRGLGARMLLQVHDELLFEVPARQLEPTASLVREAMEHVYPLDVPLVVDQKAGASWKEVT
jgi:DNA polymerase-1